jgi:hypothetical protein
VLDLCRCAGPVQLRGARRDQDPGQREQARGDELRAHACSRRRSSKTGQRSPALRANRGVLVLNAFHAPFRGSQDPREHHADLDDGRTFDLYDIPLRTPAEHRGKRSCSSTSPRRAA